MTITINDLLQTIKHRLNRHAAFPLTAPKVQQLNSVVGKFVNGGRILEDEELDAFLNPPVVVEAVEDLNQEVDVVYDKSALIPPVVFNDLTPDLDDIISSQGAAMLALASDAKLPGITEPSPEVEAALQAIVDDSQAMGLYDMKPLTMDELVAVAELQKELAQKEGLDSYGNALTAYKKATDESAQKTQEIMDKLGVDKPEDIAQAIIDNIVEGDSEASETAVENDTAVAEVTELPENTNEEAANVESEQS